MRILSGLIIVLSFLAPAFAQIEYVCVERSEVSSVWSGHSVGFALLSEGDVQFAAFYDADRNMTIAKRRIGETEWRLKQLPSKIGWDSHNYITMAIDEKKHLHLAGNMHCVPLIYFRSEKPLDIDSLVQVPEMTGENEKRCTYPHFMNGPNGELIFTYRDGSSGNGSQIWNEYDPETNEWTRMLDRPLFDGKGKMNAYFHGPIVGPDGYYHISWMWRDTPDCSTNHDFSYARSRDLRNWENSRGEKLELPITLENGEIIDSAGPGEGLLNPNQRIGFDTEGRIVLSYGKYDENGIYQLYNARLEDGEWKKYRTSSWTKPWIFSGNGTIISKVSFGGIEIENGKLVQSYRHTDEGSGRWELSPETFAPIGKAVSPVKWPKELDEIELDFPGIERRTAWDIRDRGRAYGDENDISYIMRWETLPSNRDRAHPATPPPSFLRVLKMEPKITPKN